ncbi:MAG: rRNA maturation RNase YbeY [Caulobacterales bacterium]|uniref:rRNA maturation RNase YbeY n=1 Tax=Glycocaulis sp. TaxID=1969725 RepID=UPI003FA02BA6
MAADRVAEIVIEHEGWAAIAGLEARCMEAVAAALSLIEEPRTGAAVILFSDDSVLQSLNQRFRGKDKPTNVLSFPAPESENYPGDVALAFETCQREAEARGIALVDHAAHLAVHGVLHLNGFDHIQDDAAEEMEAVEIAALARLGIANPYSER